MHKKSGTDVIFALQKRITRLEIYRTCIAIRGLFSTNEKSPPFFKVHDTSVAEDGLLGAASLMMFITVAYIGSDMSGVRGRQRGRSRGQSLIKSQGNNGIPVSVPTSDTAATRSAIQSEAEQQPRFCVCLQQMPEPTLSPDWFDMQPTRELSGGQVKEKRLLTHLTLIV